MNDPLGVWYDTMDPSENVVSWSQTFDYGMKSNKLTTLNWLELNNDAVDFCRAAYSWIKFVS